MKNYYDPTRCVLFRAQWEPKFATSDGPCAQCSCSEDSCTKWVRISRRSNRLPTKIYISTTLVAKWLYNIQKMYAWNFRIPKVDDVCFDIAAKFNISFFRELVSIQCINILILLHSVTLPVLRLMWLRWTGSALYLFLMLSMICNFCFSLAICQVPRPVHTKGATTKYRICSYPEVDLFAPSAQQQTGLAKSS